MIGTRVNERYEILAELGRGSFGIVYRALDHSLQREVALKLVTEVGGGPGPTLAQEAALTAKLNHPGVMTVFDYGTHGDQVFLVSEVIEGVTLESILAEDLPRLERSLAWFTEVARIMSYAHNAGVIHRDLSLANITLVGGDTGQIKIMDFGIGGLVDQKDDWAEGLMIGTPATMAPEQVTGAATGPATDIYAFGAGLYRLLCGRAPFAADHAAALEYSICNDEPDVLPAALPSRLTGLVMRCLSKQAADRPGDFAEVVDILEGVQIVPDTTGGGDSPLAPPTVGNPFLNRAMIQDPVEFYGRKREIRRIYARIDAENPQCVSVVGDRRIGKSSLLHHVAHQGNRAQSMTHAAKTDFVFLDFQSDFDFDQGRFLQRLFEQLAAFGGVNSQAVPSFPELEKILERRSAKGRHLVVLMDEFERITGNPKFERRFFSALRSAANHFKVAYVTSSEADLQQMCHTREISDSPFFNIFSNLPLGPFQRKDAEQLIAQASEKAGHPLAEFSDRIIGLAGLFPIYLQIACAGLFEMREDDPEAQPDWGQVRREFMEEASPHFEFAWNRLADTEKALLVQVAAGKNISREQAHQLDPLRAAGLVVGDDGSPELFGSAFGDFVRERGGTGDKPSLVKRLFGRGR